MTKTFCNYCEKEITTSNQTVYRFEIRLITEKYMRDIHVCVECRPGVEKILLPV